MKKRKAFVLTIVVLILGLIINFLFEIMPEDFKNWTHSFSNSLGLTYTLFWGICTLLIVAVMLFIVWKQVRSEKTDSGKNEDQNKHSETTINQHGPKSIAVKKNSGDIHIY